MSLAALRQELAWLEANTVGVPGERAAALESWLNVRRGLAALELALAGATRDDGSKPVRHVLRDELLAELAEVRSSCLRRAERLLRRCDGATDDDRAALEAARRGMLVVGQTAEALLEVLAGDLDALVDRVEGPGGQREAEGPPRGHG